MYSRETGRWAIVEVCGLGLRYCMKCNNQKRECLLGT
jgi:hypothetical protein